MSLPYFKSRGKLQNWAIPRLLSTVQSSSSAARRWSLPVTGSREVNSTSTGAPGGTARTIRILVSDLNSIYANAVPALSRKQTP